MSLEDSPFSDDILSRIFQLDTSHPNRIRSRESSQLEFKESFNFAGLSEYARSLAAFANARGGYIVFGVGDKPRELIGMMNDQFENLDPARLCQGLNAIFAPALKWTAYIHSLNGKKFGLLFVQEASIKPVISLKQIGEVEEAVIYYRYRGQSCRIRYPELNAIVQERLERERQLWFDSLTRMARIGVENAAILNTVDGELSGHQGSMFIPEDLLDKIEFIKEGEFDEKKGAPAIKVVGEANSVPNGLVLPTKAVTKKEGIRTRDIFLAFLERKSLAHPVAYLEQCAYSNTGYVPIFFLLEQADLDSAGAVAILKKQTDAKKTKLDTLIARLEGRNHRAALKITKARETEYAKLTTKEYQIPISDSDRRPLLSAVRCLKGFDADYLLPILAEIYKEFPNFSDGEQQEFRYAIAHLDYLLHAKNVT